MNTYITMNANANAVVANALRAHHKDPDAAIARINAWINGVADDYNNGYGAAIVIGARESGTGREVVIDLPEDCYTINHYWTVYRRTADVANTTETLYIAAPAGMDIPGAAQCDDADMHCDCAGASCRARNMAICDDELDHNNAGCRDLLDVTGLDDVRRELALAGVDANDVYLAGAGQTCADSNVAEVLGTDLDDLTEGLRNVDDASDAVRAETGVYITARQYANHLLSLALRTEDPQMAIRSRCSPHMMASIILNADQHLIKQMQG